LREATASATPPRFVRHLEDGPGFKAALVGYRAGGRQLHALVATPQLLARHGDTPFWRTVRLEAIPLLAGSHFP
jgi:hypothetical protein